jgi:transcriptional regulator with XRE-family HTH domain
MTPEQTRAARGWLGWTQQQLASEAGVSLSTVKDYEKSHRTPMRQNMEAIKAALERAGVRFEGTTGISVESRGPKD